MNTFKSICSNIWHWVTTTKAPNPTTGHDIDNGTLTPMLTSPKPTEDNIIKTKLTNELNKTLHQKYDNSTIKFLPDSENTNTGYKRRRSPKENDITEFNTSRTNPPSRYLNEDTNQNLKTELQIKKESRFFENPLFVYRSVSIAKTSPDLPGIINNHRFNTDLQNIFDLVNFSELSKSGIKYFIKSNIVVFVKDRSGKLTSYTVKIIHCIFENRDVIFICSVVISIDTIQILQIDHSKDQYYLEFLTALSFTIGHILGFTQELLKRSIKESASLGKVSKINYHLVQRGTWAANFVIIFLNFYKIQTFDINSIQLIISISLFNFKSASSIIIEVQLELIANHRNALNGAAKKLFNKHTGRLRRRNELHGNADVVKFLNQHGIWMKALYEMMSDPNVNNRKVKLTRKGYQGLLIVNSNLKIRPFKLLEIKDSERTTIFNSTKKFKDGTITPKEFAVETLDVGKTHRIVFENKREEIKIKICDMFGKSLKDIKINGRNIFLTATGHEIDRMGEVLERTLRYDKTILNISTVLAEKGNCKTVSHFIAYIELTASAISQKRKDLEEIYKQALDNEKTNTITKFSSDKFDKDYGIVGKRNQHFRAKTIETFSTEKGITELYQQFEDLKSEIQPLYKKYKYCFEDELTATYHYNKHKVLEDHELNPEEYFEFCSKVAENAEYLTSTMLTQDGDLVRKTYEDKVHNFLVVIIVNDGKAILATGMENTKN